MAAVKSFLLTSDHHDCNGRRLRCEYVDSREVGKDVNAVCKECAEAQCPFKINAPLLASLRLLGLTRNLRRAH